MLVVAFNVVIWSHNIVCNKHLWRFSYFLLWVKVLNFSSMRFSNSNFNFWQVFINSWSEIIQWRSLEYNASCTNWKKCNNLLCDIKKICFNLHKNMLHIHVFLMTFDKMFPKTNSLQEENVLQNKVLIQVFWINPNWSGIWIS